MELSKIYLTKLCKISKGARQSLRSNLLINYFKFTLQKYISLSHSL